MLDGPPVGLKVNFLESPRARLKVCLVLPVWDGLWHPGCMAVEVDLVVPVLDGSINFGCFYQYGMVLLVLDGPGLG